MAGEGNSSLIGRRLGTYELEQVLGIGGMAEVYLARDLELKRQVAVKVMLDELKREPEFERRFRSEATQVANLRHPHIIPIYAAGVSDDGLLYMVMPVVPRSLRHRLEQKPPLSIEESARLAQEVADALTAAHQIGLIHRDVKPENILLDEHDQALLTDFGIARKVESPDRDHPPTTPTLSATGLPIGTPEYMAPEQLLGEPLDQRADIYSLGAVFYEMLTGHLPHTGETPYAVAAHTLTEPMVPPSRHNRDIWPALEAVVLHAMAASRDERYPTTEAFSSALAAAMLTRGMEGQPSLALSAGTTRSSTALRSASALRAASASRAASRGASNAQTVGAPSVWNVPTMPARGSRRRWWWIAALAVLLLGIGGLSLGNLLNQHPNSTGTVRLISTTTATIRATKTPNMSATSTARAVAAQATSTAGTRPPAVPPTATVPQPTATLTRLSLSPANLMINQTTCQGSISIQNENRGTVTWQWSSAQTPPLNWKFTVSSSGGSSVVAPGQWPDDTSGIASGGTDIVTLSVPIPKHGGCQVPTYSMTMSDSNHATYSFSIAEG